MPGYRRVVQQMPRRPNPGSSGVLATDRKISLATPPPGGFFYFSSAQSEARVDKRGWLFSRRNKIMSYMIKTSKKGFTLIELLIVIGILAILATAVILILNPAQLFAQARDSKRISDLATVRGAVVLYLSTVSSPDLDSAGGTCGTNYWGSVTGAVENLTV